MNGESTFIIDLRGRSTDSVEYAYQLDTAFYESVDDSRVTGGEVEARVLVVPKGDVFVLHFAIKGCVVVSCDRCLDDVEIDIENEDEWLVKFGEENIDEGDDIVTVSQREGIIDVQWHLYELTELSLPMQCVHAEGDCEI